METQNSDGRKLRSFKKIQGLTGMPPATESHRPRSLVAFNSRSQRLKSMPHTRSASVTADAHNGCGNAKPANHQSTMDQSRGPGPGTCGRTTGPCHPEKEGAGTYLCPQQRGSISAPGALRASFFFYHSPPMPVFAPPHQTAWSTFLPCLRIWPVLCTQFMTMARVVVGSGGNDILGER